MIHSHDLRFQTRYIKDEKDKENEKEEAKVTDINKESIIVNT